MACEREGIVFIPLPVETLGGWHDKAVDQLRKLARAQARNTGKEEDEAIRHLFQRLGVLLVRGNAALFLNRVPSFPSPEIDGAELYTISSSLPSPQMKIICDILS